MSNLLDAWRSGKTVRCHTMDKLRRENTAEHTWGVLMLAVKYIPGNRACFLEYLVTHDMGEKAVADLPAHILWESPELAAATRAKERASVESLLSIPHYYETAEDSLTPEELLCAEILDRAEFVLGCTYEYKLGNTLLQRETARALARISEKIAELPAGTLQENLLHLHKDLIRLTGDQR